MKTVIMVIAILFTSCIAQEQAKSPKSKEKKAKVVIDQCIRSKVFLACIDSGPKKSDNWERVIYACRDEALSISYRLESSVNDKCK